MNFVLALVGRYIFSARGDRLFGFVTVFSVIGIAIGVAAISTVQAAQNGVISQTLAEARRGLPDITVRLERMNFDAEPSLAQFIASVPGIAEALPFVEGQAAVSFNGRTEPVLLRGIERAEIIDMIKPRLTGNETQSPKWLVVLPGNLQEPLEVFVGQRVEVISADGASTGLGWLPRSRGFEVFGFHDQGGVTPTIFAPLAESQLYLRLKDKWTGFAVTLEPNARVDEIRAILTDGFAELGYTVALETWEDINVVQADVFRVMKRVMAIVLALIMVIAGFNILASQLMLVRDKRMSIAVFRSMGASRMQLILAFVAIGFVVALAGVTSGLVLTMALALAAEQVGLTIPLLYLGVDVAVIAGIAVVICFLATLYPAFRAASVDPAIALREA